MYLIEKIPELLFNQEYSFVWGIMSILLGYLIYQQHQMSKVMDERWIELKNWFKENKYRYSEIEEELKYLRQMIKEDMYSSLRQMERELQQLDDLNRIIEETKVDQRGWFESLRDDFNQFRSEFRDILKFVLNGRKNNN
ncbi:hypothetical protein BBF96_07325 [Anoxybacter fermentans]|uniref:Uncharacterized protein n=1 Tax=Anoxybacter fermentans TaxID=1323375 RepID=A0A3Q9HQE2_9FIRM|nr:hypothetical protein [Anoxybacter fermentans]AZR73211.1 hypothetical protein BBF96_07325 [Anoxybacter fermentans]